MEKLDPQRPRFTKYEGFIYDGENLTVLVDGKWHPIGFPGTPSFSGAIHNGDPLSIDEAQELLLTSNLS